MTTAVLTLFSACTSDDGVLQEDERVPITISTAISPTRSTTTQDTQIAEDQLVYLWGFKQSGSGAAEFSNSYFTDVTDYWLTKVKSDGSLIGSSFTEKYYYPTEALTMVGIHGNFTAVDGSVGNADTHNVYADQSTLSNYAQSDLLHWSAYDLSSSSTAISAQFNHKLCKIVVVLESNLYTAADLNNALVTFNGVKPTITMTPQTGALGTVSGTATTITPYKSDNIHREAIIPPQDKPAEFITVTMNGYTTTATPDKPTTAFVANTKYIYTITVNKTGITLKTSIEAWNNASGNNSSLTPGMPTRNVKMNPLWYVAKSNLNQDASSFSIVNSTSQGYMFTWAQTMAMKYAYQNSSYDGYLTPATPQTATNGESGVSWHLPTRREWTSIFPFTSGNMFGSVPTPNEVADEDGCTFGYNNSTKYSNGTDNSVTTGISYQSYWNTYSNGVRYAIRFLGTQYCSVWKYEYLNHLTTTARLVVSSRLIDPIDPTNTTALQNMMTTITSSDYDWSEDESKGAVVREFYACGYGRGGATSAPAATYTNDHVLFWSSTLYSGDYIWRIGCSMNSVLLLNGSSYSAVKTDGFSVRLFRDNPEQDVWKNPLWYVAEYNMTNAPGATLAMATTDDAGYCYIWSSAMSSFAASTTSYDGYKKGNKSLSGKTWHLPTISEWASIISDGTFSSFSYADDGFTYKGNAINTFFGCNYETKTVGVVDNALWRKISDNEYHAIRFLGTPYCSAWKYVIEGYTLTISATMIDPVANDGTGLAAKIWYNKYWPSITWGNNASKGAVQRNFFTRGARGDGNNATPNSRYKEGGYYLSSTEYDGTNSQHITFGISSGGSSGMVRFRSAAKGYGYTVRLFLDN